MRMLLLQQALEKGPSRFDHPNRMYVIVLRSRINKWTGCIEHGRAFWLQATNLEKYCVLIHFCGVHTDQRDLGRHVCRVGSVTQHEERWVNYIQVINKCNPTVINAILGDFFVCQVVTQAKSLLTPCKFLV